MAPWPSLLCIGLLAAGCGRFGFGSSDDADDAAVPRDVAFADSFVDPNGPHQVLVPRFSTTSTTFVDVPAAVLEIPPGAGIQWLLLTSATLHSTTPDLINVEARYLVDGVERGLGATQSSMPDTPGPWQHFYVIAGTDETQTITYQLRDSSGGTATIDQLRAVAIPIPAAADARYASADATQAVTGKMNMPELRPFSLGALSGDYVVMVLANASDFPGLSDIYTEFLGPAGEVILPPLQQSREPMQSYFMTRVMAISSADAIVTLRSYVGGMSSTIQYVRVLAMRVDAFTSADHNVTTNRFSTTSATVSIANEVLPGPSTGTAFLHLASSIGYEDCLTTPDTVRGLHFIVDTADTAIMHATDNCAYEITYGMMQLLETKPSRLATGVSSGNGLVAWIADSAIVLLGLTP